MDAALSGSSISNDDSNSDLVEDIDDDFDMNSPTGFPITVYPYTMQQFPIVEFNKLCEGLYRLPSWMVYPADLATCLQAAVNIVREASRQEISRLHDKNIHCVLYPQCPRMLMIVHRVFMNFVQQLACMQLPMCLTGNFARSVARE